MSMSTTSLEPGEEIWRFQEGSSGSYEVTYAASADADGNFFLAGFTSGSIDGLVDNEGEHDLAAMKIDVNGELLWTWQEGSAGDELFSNAAATDDGGVVLGGYSNGTFNGVASEGLTDFLAVKLDADGDVEWYWQEGTDGEEDINACSKTTDGNVVLSGTTSGDWYGLNSGYNAWVAVKLDVTDGSVIWRYQASLEDLGTIPFASAARADGSIVLAGASDGPWEGSADTPYGVVDLCAVALDEDGGELWRWQDGVAYGESYIYGATALADDSVVLVGYTDASYAVTNSGGHDFLAVKVSSSGVTDWRWQSGTENDDYMTGVATGIDGTTVVLGGYTFGSWVEIQAGDTEDIDMVGISFNTDGDQLWTYQAGTNMYDFCGAVAVRPTDGAALLAGYSQGTWDGTTNYYSHAAGALLETGAEEGTVSPVLSFTPSPVLAAATTPAPLVVVTSSPLFSATPSPSGMASPIAGTLSPQPAAPTDGSLSPSTACGEGDPFRIVSTVLPGIQGCFEITSESYATGASTEIFTTDGLYGFDKIWVFGTLDGDEGTSPYYVSYASSSVGQIHTYCYTEELSTDIHPADGTWTCIAEPDGDAYFAAEDEVKFQCGCAGTPAPASPTLAPVSTPVPVAAPVVVAEEEASSSSSSSVPLGAVIGGTLAGVVFLAIVAIFMVKRRARGDESFGRPPAAPASSAGVAAGAAAGAAGKGAGVAPPPPPPDYSEPSPLEAEPAPVGLPPPPYSEPPSYSA